MNDKKYTEELLSKDKCESKAILVYFPREMIPYIDQAVRLTDSDRTKLIRNAVRREIHLSKSPDLLSPFSLLNSKFSMKTMPHSEAIESFRANESLEVILVLGEETEEHAAEEPLEVVACKAALLERVVQLTHAGVGFFVRGILGVEPHAGLPEHEGKGPNVAREVGEREAVGLDGPSGEDREILLLLGFEVVENEVREIRDEDEARDFIPPIFTREIFDVGEGLGRRDRKILAPALVLD